MTRPKSNNSSGKSARTIFTVSHLNQDVNSLLESQFGMLWVEGEVSNFSKPGSGHFYFSLKDSRAQIRCAMFRGRNRYLNFTPENGQLVLLRGKLGIYEARGDFQFIAEHMELAGSGLLQQKFEETKNRLQAAGWFDQAKKRELPSWPDTIGVITSPTGAAVRDILNVLSRRFPSASVIVYPTMVQGAASAAPICQAIGRASTRRDADVLILSRGGGSIEDLWGFNEETVAKAIVECPIPVVCGVGHEIDFTIADLAADVRAPTPSAAAELVVPDAREVSLRVDTLLVMLHRVLQHKLSPAGTMLTQLLSRLQSRHPEKVVSQQIQRTDELEARLIRAQAATQHNARMRTADLSARLNLHSPARQIDRSTAKVAACQLQLRNTINTLLDSRRSALSNTTRALDAVSPLATLSRGYSVIRKESQIVREFTDVDQGDQIEALLSKGRFIAEVKARRSD